MSRAMVSIVKTHPNPEYLEIREAVAEALSMIGGIEDIIRPGHLVLVNPSWVAPPVEREAGCTVYDTDRLGGGGVNHERGREKVSRIYENMERVFQIADRDQIPTYVAADRMAEERIRQIADVQKSVDDLKP